MLNTDYLGELNEWSVYGTSSALVPEILPSTSRLAPRSDCCLSSLCRHERPCSNVAYCVRRFARVIHQLRKWWPFPWGSSQFITCVQRCLPPFWSSQLSSRWLCPQVHVLHQHARASSQDWACSPWRHRERSAFYNWVDPTSSTGDWQQTWKAFLGGCRSEAHRKLWLVRYVLNIWSRARACIGHHSLFDADPSNFCLHCCQLCVGSHRQQLLVGSRLWCDWSKHVCHDCHPPRESFDLWYVLKVTLARSGLNRCCQSWNP